MSSPGHRYAGAGGFSLARRIAHVAIVIATVAVAGCGKASTTSTGSVSRPHPGLRGVGGVTFLGNSFASGVADSVPASVMELAVSSDGVAVSGSNWAEDNHDARLFTPQTGKMLGPLTPTRPKGGIYGVAVDRQYVYAVSGLSIYRFSRSQWMNPRNIGWFDAGSNTGVRPLTVDSSGKGWLMGLAECSNRLFVSDPGDGAALGASGDVSPNSAQIKVIDRTLRGAIASWSVPRARTIACDRQGNIWVLQQGISGGAAARVARFTPSGKLLTSFRVPGYPTGLAADPRNDTIVVPDNGRAQDFERFNYQGKLIERIGVARGYLAGPTPGVVSSDRFVGPRAVAIDGSGSLYTVESGLPGVGQKSWSDTGPMAIITKFKPDGRTVVWRDYGLEFGDVGEQSSDDSRFYDRHWEYRRGPAGRYQPYAYTVDPFRYPADDRVGSAGDAYGAATRVLDLHGHRYLTMTDTPRHEFEIYIMRGGIAQPVVWFDGNSVIGSNGRVLKVTSNRMLPAKDGAEDWWMEADGSVWSVTDTDGGGVWRYRLEGFTTSGVPRYSFQHVTTYRLPSQLAQGARRIEVFGNTVYISGFASSDPNPDLEFDGWKSVGRHLLKFTSLPTRSGWPTPAWEHTFDYGHSTTLVPYPTSFAADPGAGRIAVTWLFDPKTNQGRIEVLAARNGRAMRTLSPPAPSLGTVGYFDMQHSVEARNGWIWGEDDLQSKIYGVCLSRHCN